MSDNLITVREAADFLRISARTVYRLIESGQIGAVRIGKQWRIPSSDLPGVALGELGTTSAASTPAQPSPTINV
ncbi:MAG: helix-turn-helix domain-containing protein [bacterium]|nr:helix-turn-helix domain-containing protein [bacterium]